jgi:prevent-host-death family protein
MSPKYSLAQARSQLPTLIDAAEAGHTIELTRRGRPVAVIVSQREFERMRGSRPLFRDLYRRFIRRHSLKEVGVDEPFAASLRDRATGRKVKL